MLLPFLGITQIFNITVDQISCISESTGHSIQVYIGNPGESAHPIIGQQEQIGRKSTFTPIIPFQYSKTYTAICGDLDTTFTLDVPSNYDKAIVTSILPATEVLPANLLKFYIKFSRPMARNAYPYIYLEDSNGEVIERGILKEIPELWSENHTVLCVWIEPGRIKRGLGPNRILGPVLEEGETYRIVVSEKLSDQNAIPLDSMKRKAFTTGKSDRLSPSIDDWEVSLGNGKRSILINFHEALDYGSAIAAFEIEGVSGIWSLKEDQSGIVFNADEMLSKGKYKININTSIEDLAGNNLNRLFDQEINESSDLEKKSKHLFFTIEN